MKKHNITSRTSAARQGRILALLRDRGDVRTGYLEKEFGVTAMTVWRDLRVLEELGQLRRVHGGARLPSSADSEPDFERKSILQTEAKRLIAACAVRHFVRPGDVIGIEGGSTSAEIAALLPERHVAVVTNSLLIASRLRTLRPALPVRLLGGWISSVSGNATGAEALKAAAGSRLSICFLSATGWLPGVGPTDPNPLEIEVKRALAGAAKKVVFVMDAKKFAIRSTSVTLHPRRIDTLITDQPPPDWLAKELAAADVEIIIANGTVERPV